ncbi:hypothetical protein HN51_044595, partial [Arachis hypogaea]
MTLTTATTTVSSFIAELASSFVVVTHRRWNNHKVTHNHKIMLFKILKLVHLEVNLIQLGNIL